MSAKTWFIYECTPPAQVDAWVVAVVVQRSFYRRRH